jgi:hypothetical protein
MAKEYSQEKLWKLFEQLPQELKETVFSKQTAESVVEVCSANGIEDERISEIARYTGRVLMGILPLDEFETTIKKELKLTTEEAKKIAQEINRFVFYPVRSALEQLYQTEIAPPVKGAASFSDLTPPVETTPSVEEKKSSSSEDVYREPVE